MDETSHLIEVKVIEDNKIVAKMPSDNTASATTPGTLIVTRRIKPEFEEVHKDWLARIQKACEASPGFLKRKVYMPSGISSSHDFWTHIVTFDSMENAKHWTESNVCKQLWEEVKPWTNEESMGFVLTDPQGNLTFGIMPVSDQGTLPQAALPIRYRQCLIILLNLYPIILFFGYVLEFFYGKYDVSMPVRSLIGASFSVPCLTFFMIPFTMKYLGAWSFGNPSVTPVHAWSITIGIVAFLVILAYVVGMHWPEPGYAGNGVYGSS